MLNERKIRLMTRTAIYEQGKGKEDIKINNYGGSDYVRFNMLKTILAATVTAILIFGLAVAYKMEDFMSDVLKIDLMKLGREVLVLYIIFIAVYSIISFVVYQQRYYRASKRLKKYNMNLKKIASISKNDAMHR
ncbi:MAG: hypothetical protein MRZ59_02160 [Clostridiales bacterium]|nr:hypothetical protein [Clostridiales bacterium]MDY3747274.1 hypothetical protein [Lachnospiraceae bacterium]